MSQTIDVLIRVRPSAHSTSTVDGNGYLTIDEEQGKIFVPRPKNKTSAEFTFTKVFGPSSDQQVVYSRCSSVIEYVLDGINCCIMTYGQTNTGKTYTMYGQGWEKTFPSAVATVGNDNSSNLSNTGTNPLSKSTNFGISMSKKDDFNDNDSVGGGNDSDNDSVLPVYENNGLKEGNSFNGTIPNESASESLGIIPRCIGDLFDTLEQRYQASSGGFEYSVSKYSRYLVYFFSYVLIFL
jgi:hypothetical protein